MPPIRRLLRWAFVTLAALVLLGAIALGTLYYLIAPKLPDVESLRNVEMQEPMYVYAKDGRLMALFGETRRYPIEIEAIPPRLKQAFIAVEDARFYQHHGIDFKGISRAIWLLATTDAKRVPGGSTITQQVARQFFLSSEYSYTRKLAEMLLAMRMERELSKDEILELYLNKSFFGNRAYGVGAAAEFYYGKKPNDLSLDEMASLAGIPKFPSSGNPLSNPERAQERRDYILDRMAELALHHCVRSRPGQDHCDARHSARATGRGVRALRCRDGPPGNGVPLRSRGADQGLSRHHHHRPGPPGRGGQGGARWPGGLRPSPRLAWRRAAFRTCRG